MHGVLNSCAPSALGYAAQGWKIVLLGDAGTDRAKIPRLPKWQDRATDDEEELVDQLERYPKANIGLLLGPETGLIDVEFDGDEGRATADRLFGETITPTYASSRSVHRLFRWNGKLPPKQKIMLNGLEIRLGGGGKATQSVLPPSVHPSGEAYKWLQGLSPEEVEPADLPRELFLKLTNVEYALDASGVSDASAERSTGVRGIENGVSEGGRNNAAAQFIGSLFAKLTDEELRDSDGLDRCRLTLEGWNSRNRPPLDQEELEAVFNSILDRERKKRAAEALGMPDPSQEVEVPFGFEMRILCGDPQIFAIRAPVFEGEIHATTDEVLSYNRLRRLVMEKRRLLLPAKGAKVWEPILAKLLRDAEEVAQDPELDRPAVIASVILEAYEPTVRTDLAEIREYGVGGCFGVETVDEKTVAVSVRQLKNHLKVDWILDRPTEGEIIEVLRRAGGERRKYRRGRVWFVPVAGLEALTGGA